MSRANAADLFLFAKLQINDVCCKLHMCFSEFKLSIHVNENESCRPLQISHSPQIQGSESIKVSQAIKVSILGIQSESYCTEKITTDIR